MGSILEKATAASSFKIHGLLTWDLIWATIFQGCDCSRLTEQH